MLFVRMGNPFAKRLLLFKVLAVALLVVAVMTMMYAYHHRPRIRPDQQLLDQIRKRSGPYRDDLNWILDGIGQVTQSHLSKLEKTRTAMLPRLTEDLATWKSFTNPIYIVRAVNNIDYFKHMAMFPRIKTLLLHGKLKKVVTFLTGQFYAAVYDQCGDAVEERTFPSQCSNSLDENVINNQLRIPSESFLHNLPPALKNHSLPVLSYIHVVPHALVFSSGDVFSEDLKIIPARCQIVDEPSYTHEIDPYSLPLYDEVFTIAQYWGGGFYHFLMENMPRLAMYLSFLQNHSSIKIHIHSLKSFMIPFFHQIGIHRSRIVVGNIRAHILYMPPGMHCSCMQPPLNLQILSLQFRHYIVPQMYSRQRSIVMVERTHKRQFAKQLPIQQMLQGLAQEYHLNFEVFSDSESHSLQEAMAVFSQALVIVGPHGAGLANAFFSEPGTVIVEGSCEGSSLGMPFLCYQRIMQMLGMRYIGIGPSGNCDQGHIHLNPIDLEGPVKMVLDVLIKKGLRKHSLAP